jgi:hypothetical protein
MKSDFLMIFIFLNETIWHEGFANAVIVW